MPGLPVPLGVIHVAVVAPGANTLGSAAAPIVTGTDAVPAAAALASAPVPVAVILASVTPAVSAASAPASAPGTVPAVLLASPPAIGTASGLRPSRSNAVNATVSSGSADAPAGVIVVVVAAPSANAAAAGGGIADTAIPGVVAPAIGNPPSPTARITLGVALSVADANVAVATPILLALAPVGAASATVAAPGLLIGAAIEPPTGALVLVCHGRADVIAASTEALAFASTGGAEVLDPVGEALLVR